MGQLRCKEPFGYDDDGTPMVCPVGKLVDEHDSIAKGREAFFEKPETYIDRQQSVVHRAEGLPGGPQRQPTAPEKRAGRKKRAPRAAAG